MQKFHHLSGPQRRSHLHFLRKIQKSRHGCTWVNTETMFRMVERLHKAKLVTAYVSKWQWDPTAKRPFRELVVCASGREDARYGRPLPRNAR